MWASRETRPPFAINPGNFPRYNTRTYDTTSINLTASTENDRNPSGKSPCSPLPTRPLSTHKHIWWIRHPVFNKVLCIIFLKNNESVSLPSARALKCCQKHCRQSHQTTTSTVSSVTMGGGHFLSAYLSDPSNKSKLKSFFTAQKANNRLMPLGCFLIWNSMQWNHIHTHTQQRHIKLVYLVAFTALGGDYVLLRGEIFKVICSDLPSSLCKPAKRRKHPPINSAQPAVLLRYLYKPLLFHT